MQESSTALDFRRLLTAKGLPEHAINWVQRALHPAGSSPGSVCIPDESRVPSVCMDFRPTMVIEAPPGIVDDLLWDCLIWCPPGDTTCAVVVSGPAGTDFGGNHVPVFAPGTTSIAVLQTQASSFNGTYGYTKIYESLASLGDNINAQSGFAASLPAQFRTSYRSVTASLTASDMFNQGTVFSTQMARMMVPTGHVAYRASTNMCFHDCAANLPFDENSLNLLSPSTETRPAKEGVYMPLRLSGPTQEFVLPRTHASTLLENQGSDGTTIGTSLMAPVPANIYGPLIGPISYNYSPVFIPSIPFGTDGHGSWGATAAGNPFPWWCSPFASVESGVAVTSGYLSNFGHGNVGFDNCSQGIIIFRGIANKATITLQTYVGVEVVPRRDSPVRPFVRVPPVPEMRAIQLYYEIANSMAASYPARYNSSGALLPFLISAVKAALPHIPSIIASVPAVVRTIREYVDAGRSRAPVRETISVRSRTPARAPSVKTKRSRAKRRVVLVN